ncbi:MAG: glycoside hydrolase [Candidatus Neomarinimicrobiota bacterium]
MNIKEILVLHHSHLDVGYTHSATILWELQREFINQALELLDQTADWPPESQPRWTCEVTSQVAHWLKSADTRQIDKFSNYLHQQRIGISALQFNTTPLCNSEQLIRQLALTQQFRDQLGATINTVNQHDVNGIAWPASDLLLDSGIELLIMAVNPHFGGTILKRPNVFRWLTPSNRELLVMNGTHYTMFDQLLNTHENSLAAMDRGLEKYLKHLERRSYPYDFIYLTAAHAPVSYDNSSPNPDSARLIRQWNESGREVAIRYITPGMLAEKIKLIPTAHLESYRGDWTDYWNFGSASTAVETALNQGTKPRLYSADMIRSTQDRTNAHTTAILEKAWWNVNCFDEHTWGAFNSLDTHHPQVRTQAYLKDILAHTGREQAEYALIDALELLARNPAGSYTQDGVLLVNTSPARRDCYAAVPEWWRQEGKRHRTPRFTYQNRYDQLQDSPLCGPLEMPPFSWKFVDFKELPVAAPDDSLSHSECELPPVAPGVEPANHKYSRRLNNTVESRYYRLTYDPRTGRITGLFDKTNHREILDTSGPWTFFQLVREAPDPLVDGDRKALYTRDQKKENFEISCWNNDWVAKREGLTEYLGFEIIEQVSGLTLVLRFRGAGLRKLEQRLTLSALNPIIELEAALELENTETPEAHYFVFPLKMAKDWESHFDTAGLPVELDREQLPGACRGWVTVESYAAVHNRDYCATIFCPDAPLVQIGGFNFGHRNDRIRRSKNPLLLAWPLNNYWDTNFRASQPGFIRLKYGFSTSNCFNPYASFVAGRAFATTVEVHPAMHVPQDRHTGQFLTIAGNNLAILYGKPATDGRGVIIRVVNLSSQAQSGKIGRGEGKIKSACLTSPLEVDQTELSVDDNQTTHVFQPYRITSIRIVR